MPVSLWTSEPFLREVGGWVSGVLEAHGSTLTGEWSQPHARPWSSAVRFQSTGGPVWFKVNGPGTRREARLVRTLADLVPTLVPPVLGSDVERGWSVLGDAGPTLRSVAPPAELWERWAEVLRAYAEAQLALAEHRDALLACVADLTPSAAPRALGELVGELGGMPVEDGGLTAAEAEGLAAILPAYASWCDELAAGGIPDSLDHDDLHSANVCWVDGREPPARLVDWGDAALSHPFTTMLVTLDSIAWHAGVDVHAAPVERVRDAYLEPFSAYGDRAELVRWVDLARRVGVLGRALAWRDALAGEPVSEHAQQDFPVRAWVLELTGPG